MTWKVGLLTRWDIFHWSAWLYFGRVACWWLNQPIWKILAKMGIFPKKGVKIKNLWNHHLGRFVEVFDGETYKSPNWWNLQPSTPFLPNHWSFFTQLDPRNREKDTFCFIHFMGGPILTSPSTWLHQSFWRNLSKNATICGSETFRNHINILFHVCSILPWYFGFGIYILYMLHNL